MNNKILEEIFSLGQAKIIKKTILKTNDLTKDIKVSILQMGKDVSILIYGKDLNNNNQFIMLSKESFKKLKQLKI